MVEDFDLGVDTQCYPLIGCCVEVFRRKHQKRCFGANNLVLSHDTVYYSSGYMCRLSNSKASFDLPSLMHIIGIRF